MKTFRFIGMALFAVLMCVNLTSCSGGDDDPTEEQGKEEGGVISGKKLVKIVGTGYYEHESFTFDYDNERKLIKAIYTEGTNGNVDVVNYKFIWSDKVIKVDRNGAYECTYTFGNGMIQQEKGEDYNINFTYNKSNRIIKIEDENDIITTVWNEDKLMSISEEDREHNFIYGGSCKKGYYPLFGELLGSPAGQMLFVAHPEIAGMKTTQLPSTHTWTYDYGVYGSGSKIDHLNYEFDNDGYISKINGEVNGEPYTYTITWE